MEDSCVEAGSSKLGGDGIDVDVCVGGGSCVVVVFFRLAGSTAANASMPLATFWGRFDVEAVDVRSADCGLGDVALDLVGEKTSYLVDHFRVFSYPGHATFLFLHCKQPGAVSSHLS